MNRERLKAFLENAYKNYRRYNSSADPVWILREFGSEEDAEIAGLIVSCYSYGKVELINSLTRKLFGRIGLNVREFTLNFSEQKDKKHFRELYYRFNSSDDMSTLFRNIQRALSLHGSLKSMFLSGLNDNDKNLLRALENFTREMNYYGGGTYAYLIPLAERRSACKRLNLYLRWMVRRDEIDLGLWYEAGTHRLLFPVDTHIYRVTRKLRMCRRKSCDMGYALELTEFLKKFDANDPVKYDFALCHIGIDGKEISV